MTGISWGSTWPDEFSFISGKFVAEIYKDDSIQIPRELEDWLARLLDLPVAIADVPTPPFAAED